MISKEADENIQRMISKEADENIQRIISKEADENIQQMISKKEDENIHWIISKSRDKYSQDDLLMQKKIFLKLSLQSKRKMRIGKYSQNNLII